MTSKAWRTARSRASLVARSGIRNPNYIRRASGFVVSCGGHLADQPDRGENNLATSRCFTAYRSRSMWNRRQRWLLEPLEFQLTERLGLANSRIFGLITNMED